jgi:Tripartite tricarboxylate transporter TctB family.
MKIGQDSILGLFFAITGIVALWISIQYPLGTAGRMGPGFFPVGVSGLLVLTGIGVLVRSISSPGELLSAVKWKAVVMVPAAAVAFGLAIEPLGFFFAVLLLLVLCAATSVKFRLEWKSALGALVFATLCTTLFIQLIGLPIPVLGTLFK